MRITVSVARARARWIRSCAGVAAVLSLAVAAPAADAWQHIDPFAGGLTTVVERQPGTPDTVLLGTDVGGLYRSTDGGLHWQKSRTDGLGALGGDGIAAVAFHPEMPNVAYALVGLGADSVDDDGNPQTPNVLAGRGGLLYSSDAGQTWALLSAGIAGDAGNNRSSLWDASMPRWPRPVGQLIQVDTTRDKLFVGTFGHGVRKFSLNQQGLPTSGQGDGTPVMGSCPATTCPNPAFVTGLALDDTDDAKLYVSVRAGASSTGAPQVIGSSIFRVANPNAAAPNIKALTGLPSGFVAEEIQVMDGVLYAVANPLSPSCAPDPTAGLFWLGGAASAAPGATFTKLAHTSAATDGGCLTTGGGETWTGLDVDPYSPTQGLLASRTTSWEGPRPLLRLAAAGTGFPDGPTTQYWSGKAVSEALVNDVGGPLDLGTPDAFWRYRQWDGAQFEDDGRYCRFGTGSTFRITDFAIDPGEPDTILTAGSCTPMRNRAGGRTSPSTSATPEQDWHPMPNGIGLLVVRDVEADPVVPGRTWVATMDWRLVRSDRDGSGTTTATAINIEGVGFPGQPAAQASVGYAFARETAATAPRMCAGLGNGGGNANGEVWCTEAGDGSGSWTRLPLRAANERPRGLTFVPRETPSAPIVVAAFEGTTGVAAKEGGLWESAGGGQWIRILDETDFPVPDHTPVDFALRGDGALYAHSARAGLWRGVRTSGTWDWEQLATGAGTGVGSLVVTDSPPSSSSANVYIARPHPGKPYDGLRLIEDAGSTATLTKLDAPEGSDRDVAGLTADPNGDLWLIMKDGSAPASAPPTLWHGVIGQGPETISWTAAADGASFSGLADTIRAFTSVEDLTGFHLNVAVSGGVIGSGGSP